MSDSNDRRGQMHRVNRMMSDADARRFLRAQKVAHVATVDSAGWPYVIPLIYVYEGGNRLFVHTGGHRGHFERNLRENARSAVEVSEMGALHPGRTFACQSALAYTSVITFGVMRIVESEADKTWFFDRVLDKYGNAEWVFEPGYPQIARIVLYEQTIEIMAGKYSAGHAH
jgi:nitroimidazol reductase NimA-like FMN-containing flavoprotein (pyridoxamine 5'-phosphate oxidase superfamily)